MRPDALGYLELNGATPRPSDLTIFKQDGDDVGDGVLQVNQMWYQAPFLLSPHLLNLLSADSAERWLRVSDRVFNLIGLGSFAGVIVVSGYR